MRFAGLPARGLMLECPMRDNGLVSTVAALRRKLRALSAVARDAGATEQERSTAAALKKRLEQRLRDSGTPAGDWTDTAFRFGRWAKNLQKPAAPEGDWTDNARRLGKAVRRGYKKWLSD
jgi:hypothetical protein